MKNALPFAKFLPGSNRVKVDHNTDLSDFTDQEVVIARLMVDNHAKRLSDNERETLLHHVRNYATMVANRHYMQGVIDGTGIMAQTIGESDLPSDQKIKAYDSIIATLSESGEAGIMSVLLPEIKRFRDEALKQVPGG